MAEAQVAGGRGIVIPAPSGNADSTVIFMHGLGDTAAGWATAFPMNGLQNTRYVLPTAETMPVSLNMGMRMPSWFDLLGLSPAAPDDVDGIEKAIRRLNSIIDGEVAEGIASERIVVAGFSQGGALALVAGLRSPRKLAGIVAMSSWLPLSKTLANTLGEHAKEVPVMMCSGDVDNVVNPMFSSQSSKTLSDVGIAVEFKSYSGLAHSANPQELQDVCEFLQRILPSHR